MRAGWVAGDQASLFQSSLDSSSSYDSEVPSSQEMCPRVFRYDSDALPGGPVIGTGLARPALG